MINKIPKSVGNKNISKVTKGSSLVWEKMTIKTISFNLESDISPFSTHIPLPKDLYTNIFGKKIVSITIVGFDSIMDEKIIVSERFEVINLNKSLNEFIDVTDFIRKGTKVTIKYSEV